MNKHIVNKFLYGVLLLLAAFFMSLVIISAMFIARQSTQAAISMQLAGWQQSCDGQLRIWQLDEPEGGLQVACDSFVITPTLTITPTATLQPTPTITPTITLEPTSTITPTATLTPTLGAGFVVDHNSLARFDSIPAEYLTAAKSLRMLFSDRSVGQNINEALNCLTAISWWTAPSYCRVDYYDSNWHFRTYNLNDWNQGLVPARILFAPNLSVYDRNNWTFEFRGGDWSDLTGDFINSLAPAYIDSKDVLSYQFSYLNVMEGGNIADFFNDNLGKYDVYDLEAYIALHPDKTFVFWTSSLARTIGSQTSTNFNDLMRQYALANDKILFDVADIESHTDLGLPCYDARDGIQYCNRSGCENFADDGLSLPAICQDWTTELEGGHLGSVSGGMIALAKAFWVLMARIAGWNGG